MVTEHVAPETESQPVHPLTIEPGSGAAVSVTVELLTNDAPQPVPQVIPAGLDVTLPVPDPCLITVSVSCCVTVIVVVPVFPNGSVTVMVAVPPPTAVARPPAVTVATLVLLLVQVRP